MLQRLITQKCRAIRDGTLSEIDAGELVPGDLIVLEEGDLVPADARLLEAIEVEVDNSSLTGESTPARRYKSDQPVLISGKFLWIELPNIVFAGTSLLRGRGPARVFWAGEKKLQMKKANNKKAAAQPVQKPVRARWFSALA